MYETSDWPGPFVNSLQCWLGRNIYIHRVSEIVPHRRCRGGGGAISEPHNSSMSYRRHLEGAQKLVERHISTMLFVLSHWLALLCCVVEHTLKIKKIRYIHTYLPAVEHYGLSTFTSDPRPPVLLQTSSYLYIYAFPPPIRNCLLKFFCLKCRHYLYTDTNCNEKLIQTYKDTCYSGTHTKTKTSNITKCQVLTQWSGR